MSSHIPVLVSLGDLVIPKSGADGSRARASLTTIDIARTLLSVGMPIHTSIMKIEDF